MLWFLCILGLIPRLVAESTLSSIVSRMLVAHSSDPARYSHPPYPNITETKNQSYDQIPGGSVPLPAEEIGPCSITDKYCAYNGTARNPDGLRDQCLLWDGTCSGNQSLAIGQFFGQTTEFLYENVCFTGDGSDVVASNCTRQNNPARLAEFQRIKSWMRSSQCIASQGVYQKAHPTPDTEGMHGEKRHYEKRDNSTEARKYGGGTCCGTCNIEAGNVDVYYWPGPNSNDSCLSIIGNKVNPPDYGATTDSLGLRYWGCTKPLTGIPGESVQTITTASVMVTGTRSWKAYLGNPWDSPLCPSTSSASPGSNGSINARALDRQIYARGHSLVIPASATGNHGLPVTTVVSGDMTFTSPSIYAAFSDIGAYDSCGAEVISTTMLSFAPGELSTVVGPRGFGNIAETTLPFNFADLPCPPYSVASENFYKPEPGEPYRPLIAVPSQVRSMIPWFQYCTDLWFTGFDPPKTLVPAAAMAPPVTTSDPAAPTLPPQASATQDPGAKKPAAGWNPTPLPPPSNYAPLPKETHTTSKLQPQVPQETYHVPVVKTQTPQSNPIEDDPGANHHELSQPGSGSTDSSAPSKVQNSGGGDPKVPGDPSGQSNAQDSSSSNLPGGLYQNGSKDPTSPTQIQKAKPAQIATNAAFQNSPPNQISDTGGSGSTLDTPLMRTTISIEGHAIVASPSGVHVDGMEVNQNQAPASISGAAAVNQGSRIVIASQIIHIAAPTEPADTLIAGETVARISNGVSIQGTSVTGTSPVVIAGTTISIDNSQLYIGSKSFPLPTLIPTSTTTLANGAVAQPLSSAISIYGTTLSAGSPAATISGTSISLDSSSNLIFDGTAQALPSFYKTPAQAEQVTTINNVAVQLLPTGVSIASTTLTPGAPPITASGSPISLGSTALVVGTSSVPVSFGKPQTLIRAIGGQTITAAATAVEMGKTTLSPGAPGTTLGGTLISLGSSGNLVVGSQTVLLGAPTGSLGGQIMGGFGSGGSSANNSAPSGGLPKSLSNGTDSGVQSFEGKAGLSRSLVSTFLACLATAICLNMYLHIQ